GMPPSTPAAVIEWGTLPRQRSAAGTLRDIADRVRKLGFAPPCTILIGDVVGLKDELGWYEKLPFFGKKIVVTRAAERCGGLGAKLEELGAGVIELPLIEIGRISRFAEMDAAIRRISSYDWIVFSSHHGVRSFFDRLADLKLDARALSGVKVASVGAETSRSLLQRGIRPNLQPARFETSAVLETLKRKSDRLAGKRILLVKPDIAPRDLEQGLRKMGAEVVRLTAYITRMPKSLPDAAKKAVAAGEADYVAFTSSSTVQNFVKAFGLARVKRIARKTRFLSIGPVTTKTLKSYGLKPYLQAKTFTLDGLVDALLRRAGKKRP
ncbi:MAG TPA: bifunctional uroporphyrinogen-III C-methyltransferase/uroporphyrinogen-III synthase, partial [Pirellulaceae bacterium]|nr:bifunctional uroporphyrinogen-III C-methyltransferase/uroporphyrinogen-III synthase [Pirellulaceae bacterium]